MKKPKLDWTESAIAPDEPQTTQQQRNIISSVKRFIALKVITLLSKKPTTR